MDEEKKGIMGPGLVCSLTVAGALRPKEDANYEEEDNVRGALFFFNAQNIGQNLNSNFLCVSDSEHAYNVRGAQSSFIACI